MQPASILERIRQKIKELSKISPNLVYTEEELERRKKMFQSKPFRFNPYHLSHSPDSETTQVEMEAILKERQIKFTESSKFSKQLHGRQDNIKKEERSVNIQMPAQESKVNAADQQPLEKMEKVQNEQEVSYPPVYMQINSGSNQSKTQPMKSTFKSSCLKQQNTKLQTMPLENHIFPKLQTPNHSFSSRTNKAQIQRQTQTEQALSNKNRQPQWEQMPPIQYCNPMIYSYSRNPQDKEQFKQPKEIRIIDTISKDVQSMTFKADDSNQSHFQRKEQIKPSKQVRIFESIAQFELVPSKSKWTKMQMTKQEQSSTKINKNMSQLKKQMPKANNQQDKQICQPIQKMNHPSIFHRSNTFPFGNKSTITMDKDIVGSQANQSQMKDSQQKSADSLGEGLSDGGYKRKQPLDIKKFNIFDKNQPIPVEKGIQFSRPLQKQANTNILQDKAKPQPNQNIFTKAQTNIFNSSLSLPNIFTSPQPSNRLTSIFSQKSSNQDSLSNIFTSRQAQHNPVSVSTQSNSKPNTVPNIFGSVNNTSVGLEQIGERQQQANEGQQQGDNDMFVTKDTADPSLSTGKYDGYVQTKVYFKGLASKLKINENQSISDITVSIQQFQDNSDVYLYLRMANTNICFSGRLIAKTTRVRRVGSKSCQISKVLSMGKDTSEAKPAGMEKCQDEKRSQAKPKPTSIKMQFEDEKITDLFVKEVTQIVGVQQ